MRHCVRFPDRRAGRRSASALALAAALWAALGIATPPLALAGDDEDDGSGAGAIGIAWAIALWLPNRALDVLDPVRLRVRVGPGFALGVRATEAADLFLGSYFSVYAGLPGPRGRRTPRLPVGLESNSGIEVGIADASTGLAFGPDYGTSEVGLGFHAALIGVEFGVDPVELIDLPLGLFFIDLADDDY